MSKGYRVQTDFRDLHNFEGRYKGYDISIYSMEATASPSRAWFIWVRDDDREFGSGYNGWWGNVEHTMDEAIEEALLGTCLITEDQCRFGRVEA